MHTIVNNLTCLLLRQQFNHTQVKYGQQKHRIWIKKWQQRRRVKPTTKKVQRKWLILIMTLYSLKKTSAPHNKTMEKKNSNGNNEKLNTSVLKWCSGSYSVPISFSSIRYIVSFGYISRCPTHLRYQLVGGRACEINLIWANGANRTEP